VRPELRAVGGAQEVVAAVVAVPVVVAVVGQGDAVVGLSELLEAHQKKAPKVVAAGLALLVALSSPSGGGSNRSGKGPFGSGGARDAAANRCARLMADGCAAPRLALAALDLYSGSKPPWARFQFEPSRGDAVEFPQFRSKQPPPPREATTAGWLLQALSSAANGRGAGEDASADGSNDVRSTPPAEAAAAAGSSRRDPLRGAPEPGSARAWAENGEADSPGEKQAAAAGAVAHALALLGNLAAGVGPEGAVEARRAKLVELDAHGRAAAAMRAFPNDANVRGKGARLYLVRVRFFGW
jgi:hypothetical protein